MERKIEGANGEGQENRELCLRQLESEEITQVYEICMRKDFPESELKPLSAIRQMLEAGIYDCLGLFEDTRLMAYGFFVTDWQRGILLVDYLAVCEPWRGMGYGGNAWTGYGIFTRGKKGFCWNVKAWRAGRIRRNDS